MLTLQKLFYSLFTTQFFIAAVAVLLSIETSIVLHQPFQSFCFYFFTFFATHFAYNIYYIKTQSGQLHKMLASISFIASILILFFVPQLWHPKLLFIALPSAMYILPIFFNFGMNRGFRFFKLLLLIFVWVATTFVLPISKLSYQASMIVLLFYRIVLLSFACILFFIRDEYDQDLKRIASVAAWILLLLQFILAALVTSTIDIEVGICYLGICILNIVLGYRFLKTKQPNLQYQMFVDGVLFLQGFIVTIIYFIELS